MRPDSKYASRSMLARVRDEGAKKGIQHSTRLACSRRTLSRYAEFTHVRIEAASHF